MKESLLEWLRCPQCHTKLRISEAQSGEGAEIESGNLACEGEHTFPIVRHIPRFVGSDLYAESFGFQWNIFDRTQLDTANKTFQSYRTFLEKTGWSEGGVKGKLLLDAGCGSGRFTEIVSDLGGEVVAFDLSMAVEAAFRNIGHRPKVHIVQADVFNLPFAKQAFDFVFSIGVLHHTPDTRQAFARLVPYVRPGGNISIWIYSKYQRKYYLFFWMCDVYRIITTRLERKTLLRLSRLAGPWGSFLRRCPLFKPLVVLLPISLHPDREWRILDTFDMYSPKYRWWKFESQEIMDWFRSEGLVDVRVLPPEGAVTGCRPNFPIRVEATQDQHVTSRSE